MSSGQGPEQSEQVVDQVQLRRASLAASFGSMLEYYDFFIYGLGSALIFGPLFFSGLGDEDAQLIASFATYAVGFGARPLGAIIFGYIGDRFGRKTILVITIVLMGAATFLIGLLPTFDSIGVWAPGLLVAFRILQGLGAGAEQAGATVLVAEFAPPKRRGLFAALPFIGIQLGTLLGAGTFSLLGSVSEDVVQGWLWRVPFLASAVLVVVGLWIRMRLQESPAFVAMEQERTVAKNPLGEVVKTSWRNVARGIGLRMAENGNSSIYQTLALAFIGNLAIYENDVSVGSTAVMIGAAGACATVVLFGALSDRWGRVLVYRYGALFQAVIALPGFYLLTIGHPWLVYVVIAVGVAIGVQAMLGPQCAMLPELFGVSRRYSGVAITREFSAVLAGGIAPLLGASLLAATDQAWWAIGGYSLVLSLITFGTTFVTPETRARDLRLHDDPT